MAQDKDERKVDKIAGEGSLADRLKKRRQAEKERMDRIMGKSQVPKEKQPKN